MNIDNRRWFQILGVMVAIDAVGSVAFDAVTGVSYWKWIGNVFLVWMAVYLLRGGCCRGAGRGPGKTGSD
jgi:hypothetical protein